MDAIYDEFVAELTTHAAHLRPDDPALEEPGIFVPLSSLSAVEGLLSQVEDAVSHGAVLHAGGKRAATTGFTCSPPSRRASLKTCAPTAKNFSARQPSSTKSPATRRRSPWQRFRLRTRRRRFQHRQAARRSCRPAAKLRHVHHQLGGGRRCRHAVRWREALPARTRTRPAWHGRIRQQTVVLQCRIASAVRTAAKSAVHCSPCGALRRAAQEARHHRTPGKSQTRILQIVATPGTGRVLGLTLLCPVAEFSHNVPDHHAIRKDADANDEPEPRQRAGFDESFVVHTGHRPPLPLPCRAGQDTRRRGWAGPHFR